MIPMNYTGDIMNFEMAAEMADMEGIKTDMVVTNDDVAVANSLYTVGRRGVAGTVLVHKAAGAMAETGASRLVVDCPGCVMQLKGGVEKKKMNVKVTHISELLAENLKK